MGEGKGVYRFLVEKPEGKKPMGRLRRRWEDNIKANFRKVGCGSMDWIELAQDGTRTCECGNEQSGSIKCGEFID
jgi:hypothetical protein